MIGRTCLFYAAALLFCLLGPCWQARGQGIDALREEIRRAEAEIAATNRLIASTRDKRQDGANQLKLVRSKIGNRQKILANLDKQIALIKKSVASNNRTADRLEGELGTLKREYTAMIREGYKNYKLNNYLLFLFSSTDFNELARRMYYIRRYSRMRENKAAQIEAKNRSLARENRSLEQQRRELDKAVADKNKELAALKGEQQQYQQLVARLKGEETRLNRDLQSQQSRISKLEARIREIIEEEARKMKGKGRSEAEREQMVVLTGKFDQNKGKLPYPVTGGVIVDRFGVHPHPTRPGAMVNNKGVNIAAPNRTPVRAVFEGEVSKVFFFQGLNNSVIVRHGSYMTVYSNLSEVNVGSGDKVALGQQIGRLVTDNAGENPVLHFEVWHETRNLNPEEWLKR